MAIKFLDAVTSTQTSEDFTVRKIIQDHTVQINITGDPAAVTVDLEGSLDGVLFTRIATHPFTLNELSLGSTLFHVPNKPVRFVRAALTVLTGGTAPTVTLLYEPLERRD